MAKKKEPKFGEGDKNLTRFLKTAYEHNAPSLFCCSGHGIQSAYVVLKVTEENINLLRKIGKVLSKQKVITNFTDNHIRGKYVSYRSRTINTEWLNLASEIMENPEKYDDSNPDIFYHEEFVKSHKTLGFDLKKQLLNYLRKDIKQLPNGQEAVIKGLKDNKIPSWKLTEKDKQINNQVIQQDYKIKKEENERE